MNVHDQWAMSISACVFRTGYRSRWKAGRSQMNGLISLSRWQKWSTRSAFPFRMSANSTLAGRRLSALEKHFPEIGYGALGVVRLSACLPSSLPSGVCLYLPSVDPHITFPFHPLKPVKPSFNFTVIAWLKQGLERVFKARLRPAQSSSSSFLNIGITEAQ
ncbi:hypothetical protein B0F90DRAFT_680526 [Multifurca ochricompacta]|uniref:Uncharacterized protein n=1 Tax=Multifurca ochricompacta TaxID=376703 RepID=A0AAD4QMD6_9AGAM|nr:hypothetical protein B0F90DRAFT_680526 [Multifurca ochricompacta]